MVHPQRVVIDPPAPAADALTLFGGLKAGTDGTIQVINIDGTLNVTPTVGPGTVTFDKWADNDCTDGEVAQWVNTTLKWECSSIAGAGGLTAGSNSTITGSWRFDLATVIGDSITPAQLLHLYRAGSTAGIRMQRSTTPWDILANTNFTIGTGANTHLTFTPDGDFTLGAVSRTATIHPALTLSSDLTINGQITGDLVPETGDLYDVGSPSRLWSQAWFSKMNAIIFAEATATLFGGYSIIGPNAGTLGADVTAGAGTIDLGKTTVCESAPCDDRWIVIRASDTSDQYCTEFMELTSETGTSYGVLRNQTGSTGACAFAKGTPWLYLGPDGRGRIELNAYTSPRITLLRQGSSSNATTEVLRIGALSGFCGSGFGLGVGDPCGVGNGLLYDTATGVLTIKGNGAGLTSISGGNITTGTVTADQIGAGEVKADEIAANAVTADEISSTSAVYIGPNKTWDSNGIQLEHNSGNPRFRVGADGATTNFLKYENGALTIRGALTANDITSGGTITGSTVQTASTGARVVLNTDPSLKWFDSGGEIGSIDSTGIKVKISPSGFSSTAAYNFTGWSNFSGSATTASLSANEWGGGPEQTLALDLTAPGTTTPTTTMLNLGTRSGSSYAANIIMTALHNSTANIQFNANTSSFFINGSTLMSLTSNGRVGIGASSPGNKLVVAGTRTNTVSASAAIASIGGGDVYTYFGTLNGTPNWGTWLQSSNDAWTAQPLSINPNGGNVGIGTLAPSVALTVSRNTGTPVASTTALAQFFGADDASTPSLQIFAPGTNRTGLFRGFSNRNTLASPQATQSGDEVVGVLGSGHDGTNYQTLGGMYIFADENTASGSRGGAFKWYTVTTGGTTWSEKMRLTGAGALVIGATSATSGYELDVNGDAYIRTSLSVGSSTGTQTWDSGTTQHKFSHDVQAPGFMLNNWSQTTSGWNVVCTGAAAAGADHWLYYGFSSSSCASSSIRYKTAVQPARFDFSRILDVTPVTFEYKTSPEVPQFGVIAEVLESLGLEPLVVRDDTGMVNAVNYDKVALYLIPVVKEQRERIASLEERLAALEALIAAQHPRPDPAAIYPVLQACTTGIPPVCH